jgi:hypothetical protein
MTLLTFPLPDFNIRPAKAWERAQIDLGPHKALFNPPEVFVIDPTPEQLSYSCVKAYIIFTVCYPVPLPSPSTCYPGELHIPLHLRSNLSFQQRDYALLKESHPLVDCLDEPIVLVLGLEVRFPDHQDELEMALIQAVEIWAAERGIARMQLKIIGPDFEAETRRKVCMLKEEGYGTVNYIPFTSGAEPGWFMHKWIQRDRLITHPAII